jgi:hypothetical protein
MTVYSRFHDNVAYTDVQWAEVFNTVHLDGVDAGLYNGLKVYANTPNTMVVKVPTGRAWVQGRWYYSDDIQTLTIDSGDALYSRYDRIVLRSTVAGSPGNIAVAVLKGVPAASPVLPTLTQNIAVWEIPLATITVAANAPFITAAAIADARENLASGSIGYIIDGGGAVISTGSKGFVQVPFNCTAIGWTLLADQEGSAVVDVKSQTVTTWPASSTTTISITASNKPTLATNKIARGFCNGWTTAISEGDLLEFVVNSVATITRLTLQIHFVRTN